MKIAQGVLNENKKESTIVGKESKVKILFEKPEESPIAENAIIEMKPDEFENFDLKMKKNRFYSSFNSNLRFLKIAKYWNLKSEPNKIPDLLRYLFKYNQKWGVLLPMILSLLFSFIFNAFINAK